MPEVLSLAFRLGLKRGLAIRKTAASSDIFLARHHFSYFTEQKVTVTMKRLLVVLVKFLRIMISSFSR